MNDQLRYWLAGKPSVFSTVSIIDDDVITDVVAIWYGARVWSKTQQLKLSANQEPHPFAIAFGDARTNLEREAHAYLASLIGQQSPWRS